MQSIPAYLILKTPRSVKNIIGKPLRAIAGSMASPANLEQLGVKHATDKLSNGYLSRYQRHFEDRRLAVTTHKGSQVDSEFENLIAKTGAPDIIIDDGSHTLMSMSFTHLRRYSRI